MNRIFICYSQKDSTWREKLEQHLEVLKGIGWSTWSDRDIEIGKDWESEIQENIANTEVAILLVSSAFLASKYVKNKELPKLLNRKKEGKVKIFPILIRSCLWNKVKWLNEIQIRPKGGIPLSKNIDSLDDNLTEIAGEIYDILKTIGGIEPAPPKNIFHINGKPEWIINTDKKKIIRTKAGEWIIIDAIVPLTTLRLMERCSAAIINPQNQLIVALFDKKLATFVDNHWSYLPLNSVPLSLAASGNKIIFGDAASRINFLIENHPPEVILITPAPIIQILPIENNLILLLDTNGKLWLLEEEKTIQTDLQSLKFNSFGRVFKIGMGLGKQEIWLIGRKKIGVYDFKTKRLKTSKNHFNSGLKEIVLGIKNYFLLTDKGELFTLSKNLRQERQIIPNEESCIVGVNSTKKKSLLAWTDCGKLYRVEENSAYKQLSSNSVFAYEDFKAEQIHIFLKEETGYSLKII